MKIIQKVITPLEQTEETAPNKQKETVTIQHTAQSGSGDSPIEGSGSNNHLIGTISRSEPARRTFSYPAWPTSQPGPQSTPIPPGQHPHPKRTDQMMYEYYDQERGIPGEPPPLVNTKGQQEHRGKIYQTTIRSRDIQEETEAMARWLDDGGTAQKEGAYEGEELPSRPGD